MINEETIKEVSNFLDNPDQIREIGLSQNYAQYSRLSEPNSTWSGYRCRILNPSKKEKKDDIQSWLDSAEGFPACKNTEIGDEILNKLENVFRKKIIPSSLNLTFHINPYISRQGFPHFDTRDPNGFAGVIYLSKEYPEDIDCGTTIYNTVHPFDADLDKMKIMYEPNLSPTNRFKDIFSEELTERKQSLEVYKKIKFEYNKLICYPGMVIHSPDFYFGENLENSRMTISIHGKFDANWL
jgi:hypothetical protein